MIRNEFREFLAQKCWDAEAFYQITAFSEDSWLVHYYAGDNPSQFAVSKRFDYKGLSFKIKYHPQNPNFEVDIDFVDIVLNRVKENIKEYVNYLESEDVSN